MPEGIETKEFELQAFRDEIKKLAERNETLFDVKNFNELGEEEARAWNIYKHLFNEAYESLDQCQSLEDIKKNSGEFTQCLIKLEELWQFVADLKRSMAKVEGAEEKDKSKLEFLAWLSSLLTLKANLFSLIHDQEFLEESDLVKIKASMQIKKDSLLL
ncbi:MAG: hypothetical protein A2534_03770 [Candidatus Magasanikbacteria bacterium RIFOXYD2_FULL_39_9]|uniref:Uncharacterized protein n=1 Tax=Candidatus Magasanikbacteria bacterium RIFOXYD1_FULL_40_23 TaxID=1798705 RepID=A0A1F6PAI7_9BACT|nr:MAG: hypothetical protein A2534_03770 [Candidatus Magasanikbacteria bacterium RIFOXYD2_FULL_39_9]OGH93191.1 MAG: hypothetical protein A2563_01130 [Candidatus Magasanikbacteria bacterium RIFOXYD1_FULL_40_23]